MGNASARSNSSHTFCPLPARASFDSRLHGLHWRLYALIANHDRMGSNGTGCTVSVRKLALYLNVDHSNAAKAVNDLIQWGYVERPGVSRGRATQMRVVYNDKDHRENWPKCGAEKPLDCGAGEPHRCGAGEPLEENQEENIKKRYPAEAAPIVPIVTFPDCDLPDHKFLILLERCLSDIRKGGICYDYKLFQVYEYVKDTLSENYHEGDPIGGWAKRLSKDIEEILYPDNEEQGPCLMIEKSSCFP